MNRNLLLNLYRNIDFMINRYIEQHIIDKLFKGRAIILYGPRQVGKTTLLKKIISQLNVPYLLLNGDEPDVRNNFLNITSTQLRLMIGNAKVVIIDEAQRIENIGICLKLIIDQIDGVQVIATGSSAFELSNKINEPLTGRKIEFNLYPMAYDELKTHFGYLEETRYLEHRLIYGSYPAIINNIGSEKELLLSLSDSYLYKDLLAYDGIKKPSVLVKLLSALAFQIGQEVSYNEISQLVGADKNTVEKYIDLLEKAYVIFKLNAFSRNVRNELKKAKKIYFYDNGIRNAIIGMFLPLSQRNDEGALWENYLISERLKKNNHTNNYAKSYFWRTVQQQEIDYLEEKDGAFEAFEFKWNEKTKVRFPLSFIESYHPHKTEIIKNKNYHDFLKI